VSETEAANGVELRQVRDELKVEAASNSIHPHDALKAFVLSKF